MSEKKKREPETLVLELVGQRSSSYVRENADAETFGDLAAVDPNMPDRLSAPAVRFIQPESFVMAERESGGQYMRKIRYIQGASTIYVDEQDGLGIRPNRARDRADLVFEHGKMLVKNEGLDATKYEYLKAHSGYTGGENRPVGSQDIFRDLQLEEVDKKKMLKEWNAKQTVDRYLSQLVEEEGNEMVYEETRIDMLISMFNLPASSSYEDMLTDLIVYAHSHPEEFLKSIATTQSSTLSEIKLARTLGVIDISQLEAVFKSDNRMICQFPYIKKREDTQDKALSEFFLSAEGTGLYKQFLARLEAAKQAAAKQS